MMGVFKVQKLRKEDFELISGWFENTFEMFQCFGGHMKTFPPTWEQVEEVQKIYPQREILIGFIDSQPCALGKIIPVENNASARLGWIAIDKSLRGKGLGSEWIKTIIEYFESSYGKQALELYVLKDNIPAQRTYESNGFRLMADENHLSLTFDCEEYKVLKMIRL